MPIICRFEGKQYTEQYIPAWKDDPQGFDLYRSIFLSLVENQMMKLGEKDKDWVDANLTDLTRLEVTITKTSAHDILSIQI